MFRPASLKSKILILISVPLIVQLAMLGTVAHLQNQAEDEAKRAEYSRKIADEVIALTRELVTVRTDFGDEDSLKANPNLNLAYQKMNENISKHILNIREMTKDQPDLSASMNTALYKLRQSEDLMTQIRHQYRAAKRADSVDRMVLWLKLRDVSRDLSNQVLSLGDAGKAVADASPEKQRQFRAQVQQVLMVGGVANILLTLVFGFILTRSIVNRLNIMNDNSYRLASNKALNQLVSGGDEIAKLDRVFHRMANQLREAVSKERVILENASDCICSFDSRLKFVSANPACEELFGLTADEMIYTNFFDYVDPVSKDEARAYLDRVQDGANEKALTLTINRSDGEQREVLWSAQWAQQEGTDDRVKGDRSKDGILISIFHDVTDERAAERLKQEVVAMVTHDLRTPLTTVQNYLQFLGDGIYGDISEKATKYLPGALRSSERMMRLIGDLLDIEKVKSGMMEMNRERISLQKVFESTVEQSAGNAHELGVSLRFEATNTIVNADEQMLLRILANLVSNAIKFSPKGGTVKLSVKSNNEVVTVTVEDQGVGLPPDMLDSVFDRFQQAPNQTSRTRGGSGLGLAICKALVELHGGKIWAESQLNQGTQFRFELPVAG
ncbi:PAS domain S-box protein [bacterium]|nr:PAS domain S-box protein [bacterium]MBP9807793.1 PAS domain S-box protein [bacterium]